jgi:hypothetical protein
MNWVVVQFAVILRQAAFSAWVMDDKSTPLAKNLPSLSDDKLLPLPGTDTGQRSLDLNAK